MPPPEPAEQLSLFDLGGVDMGKLKAERARFASHRRAPRTELALASDWKHFSAWCLNAVRKPLPAGNDTVELYLVHCATELGHKVSTLQRRTWAIAQQHKRRSLPSPVGDGARELVSSIARSNGARPDRKRALSIDEVRRMLATLDRSPVGLRNRAILLLGFSTGLRRSELAGLLVSDVTFADRGMVIALRKSKTDQRSEGRAIGVMPGIDAELCAIAAVRAWLAARSSVAVRGDLSSTLFGCSAEWIGDLVKRWAGAVGLEPEHYAAHSLRAGMVTALDAGGVGLPSIMQRSGHKSVAMVLRYIRNREIFTPDPLSLAARAG